MRHAALRRAVPPPARSWDLRCTEPVRGDVRLSRTRRRGDRPNHRGRCRFRVVRPVAPVDSWRAELCSRPGAADVAGRATTADLWETIAAEAGRESELWTKALRARDDQERD